SRDLKRLRRLRFRRSHVVLGRTHGVSEFDGGDSDRPCRAEHAHEDRADVHFLPSPLSITIPDTRRTVRACFCDTSIVVTLNPCISFLRFHGASRDCRCPRALSTPHPHCARRAEAKYLDSARFRWRRERALGVSL